MKHGYLLDSLQVFVDTYRAGSFSAAGRRRGEVASTVSRQVDALEVEFGVPLFSRTTRSLTPTRAGELLYARAIRLLDELSEVRSEITSLEDEVRGTLEVSCLPTFGRRYVLPCLPPLYDAYPGLRIDLDLTEKLTVPTEERQDVTIRFGEQPSSQLIATRIASQRYVICAAPFYQERFGLPVDLEALHGHRLIDKRHRASPLGWREVLGTPTVAEVGPVLQCDDFEAQRLLALQGAGLVRLPDWVVGPDLVSGALLEVRLKGIAAAQDSGIYMLRALPRPNAKLRVFTEALRRVVGEPPAWRR